MTANRVRGATLIACAIALVVAVCSTGWLRTTLTDVDRQLVGRDLASIDLGLLGADVCASSGDCFGDWYDPHHLDGHRGLRGTTRAVFAGGLMAALLCLVGGGLILTGRGARVPRVACAVALVATAIGITYVQGAGTTRENPVTAYFGWEFHAGFALYLAAVAVTVALFLVATLPAAPGRTSLEHSRP